MARVFASYPVSPPQGLLYAQQYGLYQRDAAPPMHVPVFLNWTNYNAAGSIPNAGVQVDLGQGLQGNASLDRVSAVYVDNSDCNVPVYIYFPDTGYTVAVAPGQQLAQNVITTSVKPVIYGLGFTGGAQPLTIVYFTNRILQAAQGSDTSFVIPQYYASVFSGNPVANQTPYRTLALGDRMLQAQTPAFLTAAGNPTFTSVTLVGGALQPSYYNITGSPISSTVSFTPNNAGAYVYITQITLALSGLSVLQEVSGAPTQTTIAFGGNVFFKDSTGVINYVIPWVNFVTVGVTSLLAGNVLNNQPVLSLTGLQIKVPANATFTFGMDAPLMVASQFKTASTTQQFLGSSTLMLQLLLNYTARDESQSPI